MTIDTSAVWHVFRSKLLTFIKSKIKEPADAEDILQEVFIKVHRGLPSLSHSHKLQSWLFAITRNAMTDHFRKTKASPAVHDLAETAPDELSAMDMSDCMKPFIDRLPEKYRTAIEYCDLQGHTQAQLAAKAKISLPGAKSRLQRARAKLKELFFACCQIETDTYGNVLRRIPKGECACPS